MKTYSIIFLMILSMQCFAQDAPFNETTDFIVFHNGQETRVNILGMSERTVTFNYPGEVIQYTKSLNSIQEVRFASGRVQSGTEKISINGEHDWHKVVITDVADDIEGLAKKGELYEKSTATTIFSGSQKIDAKATKKIKKAAAAMGAHVIYLQSQTNDKGIRRVNRSIKSGIAYGYQ